MWFLPSYRRVDRAQTAVDSMVACGPVSPGVIIVNHDDPSDYESMRLPEGWRIHRLGGENLRTADCWRWAFETYPGLPWYGLMSDDMVAQTPEFEKTLVAAAMHHCIASSDDGWTARPNRQGRMTGATVIGGDLVRAVGGITVGGMRHCFIDDLWETIGRDFECWKVCDEVKVEHRHVGNGKAAMDDTYARANHDIETDRKHFVEWSQGGGKEAVYHRVATLHGKMIQKVDLAKKKVAFATPAYNGDVKLRFARAMFDTFAHFNAHGVPTAWITVEQESLIQRARNRIVCEFLKGDCTHLFFIDSDEAWSPADALRLVMSEKDLCGVAVTRKQIPATFCTNFSSDTIPVDPVTGLIKVNEVGTGFMLISRKLIEEMIEKHPHLKYVEGADTVHALFDFRLTNEQYWSEDYVFCQRAREMGYDVWVAPQVSVEHIGTYVYKGALHNWLVEQSRSAAEKKKQAELAQVGEVADVVQQAMVA